MKKCSICGQKTDIFTNSHRKNTFVDGRNYETVCFTCYFVPKIVHQKYNSDGSILEDDQLSYSCENLHEAKDLYQSGSCDNIKQAKICVEAVKKLCLKAKAQKNPKKRPPPFWNISIR